MTIKLIAADMDGTFLDNHGEYDQVRFAKDYAALAQRGIQFVIASGHQAIELATTFTDYPEMWLIGGNGAELWQRAVGLTATTFSPAATRQVLAALAPYPELQIALCGTHKVHVLAHANPQFVANMRDYYYQLETCADLTMITDPVVKFDIICPPAMTDQLVYELTPKLAGIAVPASGGQGSMDLIQPGMHKGRALKQLGEQLGISADEMLVFGDGTNDLEMFHYATHAVAMQNAPANVQANATAITGTNADNGVLAYIEQHVLA
ncbi:Cof-type HAD-IIB family hydrolase [Lactiplantibacillus paraplantarum]|uniref:Cof-type HAD-IIB family hydrolase n=1 Tax=Lactiplantibacillus paraplantarum TaxID=60520 RepID=UPI0005137B36|nr:Cof-type HAD-IIB family hydrolase [Lactiplantibacillus paraplantarum]OAX74223.1 HAD family hydrolase [Lactiplantibacillus plantarum]ALO05001.1 HAD family hydrolase [Lactiplantibacillus paraplantarum]KGE76392.1 HAD family hydrolase [Lactiplantibacillus paraplantarum]MCW1911203.1 Cof-type HAD-IIB family hydrolase [Lactiplantibacillus paraplantarum]RDG09417.1 HAD family hydrolase [Lactiplantibacillus paraplantarum]